ncbi:hypothetical protein HPP92_024863 [Vanilla planifolia]|uniref:Uncharacterized protein n=1 Tax=Vanilla planifolia TaxID=51239 RepID=A0A835PI06_VANPL|nr:hypothetical protein HPP92_024863 [Vanilla planifolia]
MPSFSLTTWSNWSRKLGHDEKDLISLGAGLSSKPLRVSAKLCSLGKSNTRWFMIWSSKERRRMLMFKVHELRSQLATAKKLSLRGNLDGKSNLAITTLSSSKNSRM